MGARRDHNWGDNREEPCPLKLAGCHVKAMSKYRTRMDVDIQETCKRGAVFPLSLSDFADVAGMAYSLHISFNNEKKSSSYKDNSFDFLSDEKSKIKKFVRISTRSYRLENGRRDPPELYSRSRRDTSTPTQTR